MSRDRPSSEVVQRAARVALRLLRTQDHASRADIATAADVSGETVKRALEWLRDKGARVEYVGRLRAWVLHNKEFALPLTDPTVEDLQAVLTAAGLLHELGQEEAASRSRALFDELAQRLADRKGRSFRPDALRVTQTTAVVREPRWMLQFLRAAKRQVLRVSYRSPWKDELIVHTFEPWQVWLHDGVLYVRGHSRTRRDARTFRLANVEHVAPADTGTTRVPVPAEPWGTADPRFGVDEDRPGEAVVRLRGAVARWTHAACWHPSQVDTWIEKGALLERRLRYRSCRELARRLVSVADGLETVEPDELHAEVLRLLQAGLARLSKAGRR